jgi:enolase
LSKITAISGRVLYNSRGSKTIEVDIISDGKFLGRVCAPSGASVGKFEAVSFPNNGPEESLSILNKNSEKFIGIDSSNLKQVHDTIHSIDKTDNYAEIGGACAFAITIAATESAAKAENKQLFQMISGKTDLKFPFPLGNILGGGAHAGPGTPDIQEILVASIGAKTVRESIDTNLQVHKELKKLILKNDPTFTNGRGDEGGWAPKFNNEEALDISVKAIENLGFTLGKEIGLGVDFASSTQWNEEKKRYVYDRAGFENDSGEQIEFASKIIKNYKLIYAEDTVHEEAFEDMAEITKKFPNSMITGDDLTVTNNKILTKAIEIKSCNAAILKVNQAGSLYDALEFAKVAKENNIKLITSHRSGESSDSHISHIGIGTGSKLLKVGIVGGERVEKVNELIRISEHDLIHGMIDF